MIRASTRVITAGLALLVWATAAAGQGSISAQGFGYPAGGLSTRAAATGGAFGEFDFASPRNPSSLLGWGRGGLYAQYDPEFRSVSAPGGSESATIARFPLFVAATQLGSRGIAALSFTTLLDRTWATRVRGEQVLGPDTVGYDEDVQSLGAINDVRIGVGYSISSAVSIGVGVHGITGENRMILVRQFDDTVRYGTLFRQLTLGYLGSAYSFGATWRPSRFFAVAASGRAGGTLDLRISDTLVASAKVPGRLGIAVRYDGLPGASVAFSAERTEWSSLKPLSETSLVAHDVWEYGTGAELAGPRIRGVPALISVGYRQRDLPFSLTATQMTERFYAAGIGIPVAGPRTIVDLGLQRASRGSVSGVRERAWIFSVALTVRP
jgi:hypothetical protein